MKGPGGVGRPTSRTGHIPVQSRESNEMDKQTCCRCFQQEEIPTHQYVKFDEKLQYLCGDCWQGFRRWFHWGQTDARDRQLELF